MSGTTQGLGDFNQEKWDKYAENFPDDREVELEEVAEESEEWSTLVQNFSGKRKAELKTVKEDSKKNRGQNVEILEKHFHDRTLQPLSDFPEVKKKEAGCSSGFQAEHQYSDDNKATFMIKSFLNRTLTKEDKKSKLQQFKESFYKASRRNLKLFPNFLLRFESTREATIDQSWNNIKSSICYDDLNIADFIREYVALYELFLHDRAPIVELVISNDLPEKRFVKDEVGVDQFKQQIEKEKKQDKLHLRSKFLNEFTTLADLKEKGEDYQSATGFEKILAAQILLGEADIIQAENFGVIEKEYENAKGEAVKEKLWTKVDHGRSFYLCFSNTKDYLLKFLFDLNQLRSYGIKVDLGKLSKELSESIDYYDKNKKEFEALIEKKEYNLNRILNPEMEFTLRYIDGSTFHSRNFQYRDVMLEDKRVRSWFLKGSITANTKLEEASNYNLSSYFKQRLETQVGMARNLVEALKTLDKAEKISSYVTKPAFCLFVPTLIAAIFTSGTVGTTFAVAAAVTGICMLVGIVVGVCLSIYAVSSCSSKIDNPNSEKPQIVNQQAY